MINSFLQELIEDVLMIVQVILLDGTAMSKLIGTKQQFVLEIVETESRFKMKLVMMGTTMMETAAQQIALF